MPISRILFHIFYEILNNNKRLYVTQSTFIHSLNRLYTKLGTTLIWRVHVITVIYSNL
jgi:hypothetical protein